MIVSRKAIPRRTVLRGIGTALALPLLDSMVPALSALRNTPAKPTRRFGVVYTPNGMVMPSWTPAADGDAFEFTPTLKPLEPFRDRVMVLTGLSSKPPANSPAGAAAGVHARASTRFMTHVIPKRAQGAEISAGISTDQIAAAEFAKETQLGSLELALEGRDFAGSCDAGYSCAYTNTISWRTATTPLPMENDPRAVFERLFGDGGVDPAARQVRRRDDRSILDSVTQRISDLNRKVGPRDRSKLSEYFDALRDIERRIQKAEEQNGQDVAISIDQPAGIPASYEDHARLMFDLQVLAYQTDLTRVITFMIARELSGRSYPQIGVAESHHPISHHLNDPGKLRSLAKINLHHMGLFAYYVEKLRNTPDGDGTLLDNVMIIYGAGMADSNLHAPSGLPVLVVGGGGGTLRGGRHLKYQIDTPVANLHLALLDRLGITEVQAIGDSSGRLDHLSM
ncbi:MAG TPA: DUF1552 domain-containing protein [Vicinamibacterales bacterium]|jgi:hypothetical protein